MSEQLRLSIDVYETAIVATDRRGKELRRFYVTADDLVKLLNKETRNRSQSFCRIDKDIVGFGVGLAGEQVLITYPGRWINIEMKTSGRKQKIRMRCPNLLVQLVWQKGCWVGVEKILAYAGELTARTMLYVAPMPNVTDGGSVCMGSVSVKEFGKLSARKFFERAWLDSMFTPHYLKSCLKKGSQYSDLMAMVKKTKGKIEITELDKVGKYGEMFR